MTIIKRYSNRKLYDTGARRYITLDEIAERVRQGEEVSVIDHASGENLTTLTLLQALFEQQKKGGGLFPQVLLTRLIRSGSGALSSLREAWAATFDFEGRFLDELRRRLDRLVALRLLAEDQAARLFDQLSAIRPTAPSDESRGAPESEAALPDEETPTLEALESLRLQIEALEAQIAALKGADPSTAA